MVAPPCSLASSSTPSVHCSHSIPKIYSSLSWDSSSSSPYSLKLSPQTKKFRIRCSEKPSVTLKTCKNCKTQFDPAFNHPRACRFHTAHFGGETRRKFESVYEGGTMDTPNSGQVFHYWHCCGSEDPFDPGCIYFPHLSYDD